MTGKEDFMASMDWWNTNVNVFHRDFWNRGGNSSDDFGPLNPWAKLGTVGNSGTTTKNKMDQVTDLLTGWFLPHVGQQDIERQNLELMRDQLDYDKWRQQRIWDRSDNEMQRRAEDLEAAGYSKWFTGSGASVGQALGMKAPQQETRSASVQAQTLGMIATVGKTFAEMENIKAQAEKTRADTEKTKLDTEYLGKTMQIRIEQAGTNWRQGLTKEAILVIERDLKEVEQHYTKAYRNWLSESAVAAGLPENYVLVSQNPKIQENMLAQLLIDARKHNMSIAELFEQPVGKMETGWEKLVLGLLQKMDVSGFLKGAVGEMTGRSRVE